MSRIFFILGSLSAFIGVALGAFAAHGLKNKISSEMLTIFEVGVRYQMYHAFALFVVAWASTYWKEASFVTSGILFVTGTLFFSGSLYLLSVTGNRWLGAITPVGGLLFLWGWFALVWTVWKSH